MERVPHERRTWPRKDADIAVSAAAGLIGGLVASWLMVEFQHRIWPPPKGDGGEPSTSKLARHLAQLRSERPLTEEQAKTGGEFVHYALGAGLGLLYGAVASSRPAVTTGAGLPFGIVTEIILDQALVPALGLSNPFWKCPVKWSVRGLVAHLLFGLTTEASRRLVLSLFAAAAPAQSSKGKGDENPPQANLAEVNIRSWRLAERV